MDQNNKFFSKDLGSLTDWFDDLKLPFNRFYLFLSGVIIISGILGVVSFRMYQLSGAEALDLSRPGYQVASKQTKVMETEPKINQIGQIDDKFKTEVSKSLDFYYKKMELKNAFSGELLTDESLGLPKIVEPVAIP